jgi:hypothetical protein
MEKGIPTSELIILNNWRLYFKASFLSEICVAEGDRINSFFITYPIGTNDNGTESLWTWPEQAKPGYKSSTTRRLHLKTNFFVNNSNQVMGLGEWDILQVLTTQQQVAYFHCEIQQVYIYAGNGEYRKYQAKRTRPNTAVLDSETPYTLRNISLTIVHQQMAM